MTAGVNLGTNAPGTSGRGPLILDGMQAISASVARRAQPGGTRQRQCDAFLVALTRAADHSLLWVAVSGVLAAAGQRGRGSAARGLAAIAVASTVTNGILKPAFRRPRPGRREPLVPRPGSFSFPSGHSASAFAFTTVVSYQIPALAPVLLPLAGAVAYSRVRTGVHHGRDVIAGSAAGAAIGAAVISARRPRRRARGAPDTGSADSPGPEDLRT